MDIPTPYSKIFDRFYKKLYGDKHFFNYKNLPTEEIQDLVQDHSIDLLIQSVEFIYSHGSPEFDFYDNDDILLQFNGQLVPQEIGLLVDLMYLKLLEEDRNRLRVMGLTFTNSELNLFSPANDRKTFLDMLNSLEKKIVNSLANYFSRDRLTWKCKSIYKD